MIKISNRTNLLNFLDVMIRMDTDSFTSQCTLSIADETAVEGAQDAVGNIIQIDPG